MSEEPNKLPENDSGDKLIETTGRSVKKRPVPLRFGGTKSVGDSGKSGQKSLPHGTEAEDRDEGIENPRRIIRQGMLIIFFFFGVLGIWAFFGHIQGAVVGSGRIKIETERKTVQHLEGGIVEEILVREGQEVVQGQPLIVLQSVKAESDASAARKELVNLEAQRLRAIAEKDGEKELVWPEHLIKLAAEADSSDILANEEKLFESRREVLNTQISLFEKQLAQIEAQGAGAVDQLNAESRIISTLQEELSPKRKLHQQRYVDKTQILTLERQLAAHQGERGKLKQAIAEGKQRAAEIELRIKAAREGFVHEAAKNLSSLDNLISQTREKLRPLEDATTRLQIKAPVSGRVVDMKVHTKGAVIHGGETVMDIVPHDNPLIVETQVPINKITEVYLGQNALVQLDAFDTRMVPPMRAKVTYISADALSPPDAAPYYLCYVEVDPEALTEEMLYLTPGMPATVFITTREQTVVYYMFGPYIKSWQRALRD